MLVSKNYLSMLTGHDNKTISRRLRNLNPEPSGEWRSDVALREIYSPDALNPSQEKALLDKARRELCELKKAEMEKQLLPADEVRECWSRMIGNARAKLLNLPSRLAATCIGVSTIQEAESAARDLIYEALHELATDEVPDDVGS